MYVYCYITLAKDMFEAKKYGVHSNIYLYYTSMYNLEYPLYIHTHI